MDRYEFRWTFDLGYLTGVLGTSDTYRAARKALMALREVASSRCGVSVSMGELTNLLAMTGAQDNLDTRLSQRDSDRIEKFVASLVESNVKDRRELLLLNSLEGHEFLNSDLFKHDYHKELHLEAITCLECGAYVSAYVMTWALVFDVVRGWLFKNKNRLAAFNAELTKNPNQRAVATYDDFYSVKESLVIDKAYAARLFTLQKKQILENALTDRNHFAHPSNRKATLPGAIGYMETLYVNIVSDRHFR